MGGGFVEPEVRQAEIRNEYHTMTNADGTVNKSNVFRRGMSEYSGGSRGGAVAPPSLNNFKLKMIDNELRQSVDSANIAGGHNSSGLSQVRKQKQGIGLSTAYKMVQDVPFIESVHNVISNYKSGNKNQLSRRKILAESGQSKTDLQANLANFASAKSLVSNNAEIGKHVE